MWSAVFLISAFCEGTRQRESASSVTSTAMTRAQQAQQAQQAPRFWIENNSDQYIEFWIRASDRNRKWSKIKIQPRQAGYAILRSSDPFDFVICRYAGGGAWIYEQQSRVSLKAIATGAQQVRQLNLYRYAKRPVYQTSQNGGVVLKTEILEGRDVAIDSDGLDLSMQLEYEGGYQAGYQGETPPPPKPPPGGPRR